MPDIIGWARLSAPAPTGLVSRHRSRTDIGEVLVWS